MIFFKEECEAKISSSVTRLSYESARAGRRTIRRTDNNSVFNKTMTLLTLEAVALSSRLGICTIGYF